MPTRLKRPSPWRGLFLAAALLAFQGYLAASVFTGQFGIENSRQVQEDIEVLSARSASLQEEIDAFRHRIGLLSGTAIDPDLLGERARALLSMAKPDDIVVMTDPKSGQPSSGSPPQLAADRLTDIIAGAVED